MRDFIDELKYMCSASNTKSRGTYIMIAGLLILLPILAVVGVIVAIVRHAVVAALAVGIVTAVVALAIWIALIIWLKKS